MPRPWRPMGMVAFQVRTPLQLKERLVALAISTGQSQQSIITRALEAYLDRCEVREGDASEALGED